jgi:hypothetical protein
MAGTIVDDDAFLERAAALAEHAREGMLKHRKHASLVFLWLPSDELNMSPLQRRFEPERRAWSRVAREVVSRDARGILFIGEGWADDGSGELALSLIVAALTRSGRARTVTTAFDRPRGRRLALSEPRVLDEPPLFLEGARQAWLAADGEGGDDPTDEGA